LEKGIQSESEGGRSQRQRLVELAENDQFVFKKPEEDTMCRKERQIRKF
jgi:hypothetical protein